MQKFLIFMGIGLEIGFLIVVAQKIGQVLDETYHTNGLIFVGLSFLMLIGWLIQVIWLLRRFDKEEKNEEKDSGSP